jgi:hypothetical protein
MCPACIASTVVMVAGAGSTGGILAVCIGKFRKFFSAKDADARPETGKGTRCSLRGAPDTAAVLRGLLSKSESCRSVSET